MPRRPPLTVVVPDIPTLFPLRIQAPPPFLVIDKAPPPPPVLSVRLLVMVLKSELRPLRAKAFAPAAALELMKAPVSTSGPEPLASRLMAFVVPVLPHARSLVSPAPT